MFALVVLRKRRVEGLERGVYFELSLARGGGGRVLVLRVDGGWCLMSMARRGGHAMRSRPFRESTAAPPFRERPRRLYLCLLLLGGDVLPCSVASEIGSEGRGVVFEAGVVHRVEDVAAEDDGALGEGDGVCGCGGRRALVLGPGWGAVWQG